MRRLLSISWALAALSAAACSGGTVPQYEASQPAGYSLDARDTKLLDLRFRSGSITLTQSEDSRIRVDGRVFAKATDEKTAALKASAINLNVVSGRVTMLNLPEPEQGMEYGADLNISVPKNINLRVVIGDGQLVADIDPPQLSDLQVWQGYIELRLPKSTSAYVFAETNVGGNIEITDFDRSDGAHRRQLTHAEFEGTLGAPIGFLGRRIDIRVNAGGIALRGK